MSKSPRAKKTYPHVNTAMKYISDVLYGRIDVCKYVKLATQRHLDDLKKSESPDYPYYFDPEKAERVCRFLEMMIHTKGKWARTPIKLEPWQCFSTVVAFGWMKRATNKRRFRYAYNELPRKNGKSAWSAALGNYMLVADGENGSEVYSGAASQKQAWEVFGPARLMAKWNTTYNEAFSIYVGAENISVQDAGSKFEPLIGDPGDGASPHFAIVDEFHEHKKPNLHDTMSTGMGSREQPMMWIITTAGMDTSGPCYHTRDLAIKVLEGAIENDELFALIYTIDEADDWKEFNVWKKANPNYGVSLFEDYLYSKYREAMQSAEKQNINLCKHLNKWSNAVVGWINMAKWEACADREMKMEDFIGQPCWVGVDLASKIDLTAMMFLFKIQQDGKFAEFMKDNYVVFGKYYLPEETVERPENAHYRAWRDKGLLTVTPGARTDYGYLEDDLKAMAGKFDLVPPAGLDSIIKGYGGLVTDDIRAHILAWKSAAELPESDPQKHEAQKQYFEAVKGLPHFKIMELAYDAREAEYLINNNIRSWADFDCIEVPQSATFMSEPMKELEALYMERKIRHNGCGMLKWQASNVIRRSTKTKAFYPGKERDKNKIDAIVAIIMALQRAMVWKDNTSIYESRGPLVLSF